MVKEEKENGTTHDDNDPSSTTTNEEKKDNNNDGIFNITFTKLNPLPDGKYGTVPCTRSSHGLSLYHNKNQIVIIGGEHVARTPLDMDEFVWIAEKQNTNDDDDTSSWKWHNVRPSKDNNNWPPKRVAHAQASIDDDVYIFGGRAGIDMSEEAMNDLWKFHIPTETWTKIEPSNKEDIPEARSFHRMVVHNGNKLFVFGGCGSSGRLNDLYEFDINTNTWINHGCSKLLAGRGGPNVLPFRGGGCCLTSDGNNNDFEPYIAIIAGFKGEESNDGHICRRVTKTTTSDDDGKEVVVNTSWVWDTNGLDHLSQEENNYLRPRSVCISGTFPKSNIGIIFGGEVNPSDRGHEGAGGFANDVILLDGNSTKCHIIEQITSPPKSTLNKEPQWPEARGWSAGDTIEDNTSKKLYFFGGLTGDDINPKRLNDLWVCEITSNTAV